MTRGDVIRRRYDQGRYLKEKGWQGGIYKEESMGRIDIKKREWQGEGYKQEGMTRGDKKERMKRGDI